MRSQRSATRLQLLRGVPIQLLEMLCPQEHSLLPHDLVVPEHLPPRSCPVARSQVRLVSRSAFGSVRRLFVSAGKSLAKGTVEIVLELLEQLGVMSPICFPKPLFAQTGYQPPTVVLRF